MIFEQLTFLAVVSFTAEKAGFRDGAIPFAVGCDFVAEEAGASSAGFATFGIVIIIVTEKSRTRSANFFTVRIIVIITAKKILGRETPTFLPFSS